MHGNLVRNGVARAIALLPAMLLTAAIPAAAQSAEVPATPQVPHTDRYHGETVRDPYRWLERTDSLAVREWARAQDTRSRRALKGTSRRDYFRTRIESHTATTDYSVPAMAGDRLFYLVLRPDARHNAVAGRWGGEERILFDPDAHISQLAPSPSGDRLLVTVSPEDGSSPWTVLLGADGTRIEQPMLRTRVPPSPWTLDGAGFFFFRQDEDGGETLMLRRGPEEAARPVDAGVPGWPSGEQLRATVTEGRRWLVVGDQAQAGERVTALRLGTDGRILESIPLIESAERYDLMGTVEDGFLFRSTAGAARGRVIQIDTGAPSRTREVVPESDAILDDAFVFGGRIVAYYLRNAKPEVVIYGLDGTHERTVELPFGLVFTDYLRDWPGFSGDADNPHVYFRSLNMTAPGVYRLDVRSGVIEPFLLRGVEVDPGEFVMRQVSYESADGAKVPMFVAHRKDVALDGSAPALIWAYGAYGWTPVPFFNAKYLTFLESGGVFAIPYARGGGVRGAGWHEAGIRARKQNTIDDVIAGAQWLVNHGYTSPDRLGLEGQGPAGAAVGGAVTQRPDLFGAVIFDVAVTDMLRREAAGNPMTGELGTVSDPEEFRALSAYSPYHRALTGAGHPAALIKTGDRDQVVPTMHAYKMTAALQSAPDPRGPVYLRVDWTTGHGFGKTQQQRHEEWVDDLSFLSLTLGGADPLGASSCPGPRLLYLANMGMLVEGRAGTILIDAPFTGRVEPFPPMSDSVRARIEAARPPFDTVRWVLITHGHRDHYEARGIARHVRNNPGAQLVSTDVVVSAVADEAEDEAVADEVRVGHRAIRVDPSDAGWSTVVSVDGITIRVTAMSHGPDRDVENLAFLVDIDGVRILHVGDSEVLPEDLAPRGLDSLNIDYAVLPTWYRFSEPWAGAIELIAPANVLLAHLPAPDYTGGFVGRHGGWEGVIDALAADPLPTRALRRSGEEFCLMGRP